MTEQPSPDIVRVLREQQASLADARAPESLDDRIAASLEESGPSAFGLPWIGATAAIVLIAIAVASYPPAHTAAPATDSGAHARDPDQRLAVRFDPPSCAPSTASNLLRLSAGCSVSLAQPSLSIRAQESAELARSPEGIRVRRGAVRFTVDKLAPGARPVSVWTSGGRIEVIGTRFVVQEDVDGGSVALEEGRIDFLAIDGQRSELWPGQIHRWRRPSEGQEPQLAPAIAPTPAPARSAQPHAGAREDKAEPNAESGREPASDRLPLDPIKQEPVLDASPPETWSTARTAAAVDWVSQLRAQGRHKEAVLWIGQLLRAPLEARAAEVLSFERGMLLERKLADPAGACSHWRSHQLRFGKGRYAAEVATSVERCTGQMTEETRDRPAGE